MARPNRQPPKEGASPEFLELALKFLRQAYGSKPIGSMLGHWLGYHLGELEREYAKEPESTTVARAGHRNGNLWQSGTE